MSYAMSYAKPCRAKDTRHRGETRATRGFSNIENSPAQHAREDIIVRSMWASARGQFAATEPEMPEPQGRRVGRFRVIDGGLN